MIRMILCAGAAAVLVTALIRGLTPTRRGLLCWTFSSIAAVAAAVVYFAGAGNITPDILSLRNAVFGVLMIALIIMLVELFAPSHRLRQREDKDYDKASAESALNIVFAVVVASSALSALLAEVFGRNEFCVLGLVPAAALSLRQLSYFMYRGRVDSLSENDETERRRTVIRSLSTGKKTL